MKTHPRFALSLLAILALGQTLTQAQVPDGHAVRFSINNNAPGIEFVRLDGTTVPIPVTGLGATGQINAGAIDPLTGQLWICDSEIVGDAHARLFRLSLVGSTVQTQQQVVNLGADEILNAIAFDRDNDAFVLGGGTAWKVDRVNNTVSVWDSNVYTNGSFNAMTIDPVSNTMWVGSAGLGDWVLLEYDLDAGPGPGTTILTVPGAVFAGATGIAYDGGNLLYVTLVSTPGLRSFDLTTSAFIDVVGAPDHGMNGVAVDQQTGLVHVVGGYGDSSWHAIDPGAGTNTEIAPNIDPGCAAFCPVASGLVVPVLPEGPIVMYCSGDGIGGTPCPCGNNGAVGSGCTNSTGLGARLSAGGTSSVIADDLEPRASRLVPGKPALLFAGTLTMNGNDGVTFGDGLRCVGGSITRLDVRIPEAAGAASWGPGILSANGWGAGTTVFLQAWYRDSNGSPCGNNFNLSNGLSVLVIP